jgi:4-hydroxymandelate oxidase
MRERAAPAIRTCSALKDNIGSGSRRRREAGRKGGGGLDSADFDALEDKARARLSSGAYAFAAAGADDEITLAENIAAWRRLRLRPRVLNDIAKIDTGASILGVRLGSPIMVAPFGRHKLFHPEGERATARGAAAAGAVFVLPTTSTVSMEEAATEPATAPRWFQLYLPPDRALTENLIDRAAAASFRAIVLTVDQPVYGSSPRAARAPLEPSPDIRNANLPGQPIAQHSYKAGHIGTVTFPATLRDLEWLVSRSRLDVVVKGVLRGDDAVRCVEAGAKAIIVSNHGGRHLDGTIATADALPEIAGAIAGKAELYVDGGIRRGTDIVKALALGARAVLVARPVIWGLALDGAEGVRTVLDHLNAEFARAMALCGAARLADIRADVVADK